MSEQMNDQEVLTVSNADENSAIERCLTFESGDLILYISTKHVIEIINNHSITTLPLVPPYIKGIINLRGQILPVVDLQQRMGKEDSDYTSKTCIIVLEIEDSVRQVVDINLKHVRPIPIKRQQKLLDGMVIMEDGSVFMSVDCQALSSTED